MTRRKPRPTLTPEDLDAIDTTASATPWCQMNMLACWQGCPSPCVSQADYEARRVRLPTRPVDVKGTLS